MPKHPTGLVGHASACQGRLRLWFINVGAHGAAVLDSQCHKHAPETISADDTVSSGFSKVEIEAKSERDSYVL